MNQPLHRRMGEVRRLAIVCTHPIQYYAPVFRALAEREGVDVKVFYSMESSSPGSHDAGFGQRVEWDVPLLHGYEYEFGCNLARHPSSSRFKGVHDPTLNSRIEAWGPDFVLVYGWANRAHLAVLRHFKGRCTVLFRGDSTLLDERSGLRKALRRLWLRWVYKHVDMALAVGTRSRKYFEAMGLRGDQVVVAPHSIDNERFASRDAARLEAAAVWRQELGIPDDAVTFLFVGKLEANKAPELLLEAFLASCSNSSEHLVFVGSGPLEEDLRRMANDRVHYLGFQNQSEIPTVYRLGDLLVLPSGSETWGLAVNEAMASSRAVIVSDRVGCAIDLVEPSVNGWVFTSSDVDALKAVLSEASAEGRGALLERGRRSAERIRRWSIERQVEVIERVLRS